MSGERGRLREDSITGESTVYVGNPEDIPEDAIVVDLREEHGETYDDRERFSEWSDEKVERKQEEAYRRLGEAYGFEERLNAGIENAFGLRESLLEPEE
jgi:hypothetical protein